MISICEVLDLHDLLERNHKILILKNILIWIDSIIKKLVWFEFFVAQHKMILILRQSKIIDLDIGDVQNILFHIWYSLWGHINYCHEVTTPRQIKTACWKKGTIQGCSLSIDNVLTSTWNGIRIRSEKHFEAVFGARKRTITVLTLSRDSLGNTMFNNSLRQSVPTDMLRVHLWIPYSPRNPPPPTHPN